jgi:hypothetical protein
MALKCIEPDIESSVVCRYSIRIVPLEILCCTIPDIGSFKIRIVSRIESPARLVEFVGKLQKSVISPYVSTADTYYKLHIYTIM